MAWLHDITKQICDHLRAQPFFSEEPAIPIFGQDERDLNTRALAASAKLAGVVVLIAQVRGNDSMPDLPKPRGTWQFIAEVQESPPMNRKSGCGQPAAYIAQVIAILLKGFRPAVASSGISLGEITLMPPPPEAPGSVVWQINFSLNATLGDCDPPMRLDWLTEPTNPPTPLPDATPRPELEPNTAT